MAHTSQDVSGDAARDGASPSRAVAPPSFHRPSIEVEGIMRSTSVRVWCSDFWKLSIGVDHESGLWMSEAGVDRLIGELLAAREQFRMEREAKAKLAEVVEMACPVPDSDEDVPF